MHISLDRPISLENLNELHSELPIQFRQHTNSLILGMKSHYPTCQRKMETIYDILQASERIK